MIFESHAHYDDEAYDEDRHIVLESMSDNGIGYIVNVAASLKSIETSLELAHQYDHVYASVGVHPNEVGELDEDSMRWIEQQANDSKCVSIGEIGLDYHYPQPPVDVQKKWFERQLLLAKKLDKPIIIHSREAAADTMDILRSDMAHGCRGVMHCYSYSLEIAKEVLKLGYYIGIGGVVTFSNAKKLVEVVEYLPMDRILLETDCPYLAPTPHRGERNISTYLPLIAEKIAQIKGITLQEVIDITSENAKKMYFHRS